MQGSKQMQTEEQLAAGLPELPEKVLAAVFAALCDRGRNYCILF